MITGSIDVLEAAVDAFVAEDLTAGPLGDDVLRLERLCARLDCERARRIVALDRSSECTVDGSRCVASWVVLRNHGHYGEIKTGIYLGRFAERYPLTGSCWADGSLSTAHVKAIARIEGGVRVPEQFAVFEPELVEYARSHTPREVAQWGREWHEMIVDLYDGHGSLRPSEQTDVKQVAHYSRTFEGMGVLDAVFANDDAEIVGKAIRRAYETGHGQT